VAFDVDLVVAIFQEAGELLGFAMAQRYRVLDDALLPWERADFEIERDFVLTHILYVHVPPSWYFLALETAIASGDPSRMTMADLSIVLRFHLPCALLRRPFCLSRHFLEQYFFRGS